MTEIPAFPRHLNKGERRAVLIQAARDMAEETIRETGADPACVRDSLTAEAVTQITLAWLSERVAALEVAAHPRVRKARNGEAIK